MNFVWNVAVTICQKLGSRAVAIIIAGVALVVTTVIMYAFGAPLEPSSHWGAVFASWVAGVALFAAGTVAVGIFSLIPPEHGSFDSRARILFRGQDGLHIDYIVKKIGTVLEQYSRETHRTIVVKEYDQVEGKFLVITTAKSKMRSYIEDLVSSVGARVEVTRCSPSPHGRRPPRIVYVRCNGAPVAQHKDFDTETECPYNVEIAKGGETEVETQTEYWVHEIDDAYTHTPIRYVKRFSLVVENHLDENLRVKLKVLSGKEQEIVLGPATTKVVCDLPDVKPEERLFSLWFLPIEPLA